MHVWIPMLIMLAAPVLAQQAESFAAGPSMSNPRYGHSATMLQDGKVLLAGGDCVNGLDRTCGGSAEIFDPAAGASTPTGKMIQGRSWHSATLLADGRVLIAGGYVNRDLDTAEIYDPATGMFTAAGKLLAASREHSAILQPDGKVFLAGGFGAIQLYDPSRGTFSQIPTTRPLSRFSRSVRLINSRILTTAGLSALNSIYDPVSQALIFPDNSANYRKGTFSTVTLLPDGKALIAGGTENVYDEEGTPNLDLYDPETNLLQSAGRMTRPRVRHTSTLLPNGNVLLTGGAIGFWDGETATADIYSPAEGAIRSTAATMSVPRDQHTATLLRDGRVFIAGGSSALGTELYTPSKLSAAPEIYTLDGTQPAVVLGATGRLVSRQNPAAAGDVLEIYLTGLSERTKIPPMAFLGGRPAEVLYFGRVAGYESLHQINIRVPAGTAHGESVSLWISDLERPSNRVALAIRP